MANLVTLTTNLNNNCRSLASTWAAARDGTGSKLMQGGFYCETSEFGGDYTVSQWFAQVDISSIPNDAIVDTVSLELMPFNVDNTDRSWQMEVYDYDWGAALGTGDFRTAAQLTTLYNNSKRLGYVQHSNFSVNNYATLINANLKTRLQTAISAGDTNFRMLGIINKQRTNSAPGTGGLDSVSFYDHGDAASERPRLNVYYHSAQEQGALFCMGF